MYSVTIIMVLPAGTHKQRSSGACPALWALEIQALSSGVISQHCLGLSQAVCNEQGIRGLPAAPRWDPLDPRIRCSFYLNTEPPLEGGQRYSVNAKATSPAQDSGQKYLLSQQTGWFTSAHVLPFLYIYTNIHLAAASAGPFSAHPPTRARSRVICFPDRTPLQSAFVKSVQLLC